jgi:hypothetical protein
MRYVSLRLLTMAVLGLGTLQDPPLRRSLVELAERFNHPAGTQARARFVGVLNTATPANLAGSERDELDETKRALADEVSDAALRERRLIDFCTEHGIGPSEPIRRAVWDTWLTTLSHDLRRLLTSGRLGQSLIDDLWSLWLSKHDEDVLRLLRGLDRSARGEHELASSVVLDRIDLNVAAADTGGTVRLLAREDHTIDNDNSRLVLDGIASTDKEQVWLERSYHVAPLDHDADLLFEQTAKFVRRVTGT